MIELAEKLNLSAEVIEKLKALHLRQEDRISLYAEKCKSVGFHCLKLKSKMFILAVILQLAVDVKDRYDKAGIDEKIYYDTMSDIKIWCAKTGNKGLKNYGWLKNHVMFELFRLGRLQFQLYECKNKTLRYKSLPFGFGEKLVYVHIPEGESLDEEKCKDSFRQAGEFFDMFFPEYEYRYYFCESWLLFEGNRNFMKSESNIVRFMSFFDIRYSLNFQVQTIERVYGRPRLFKKNYPENTSLQKSAKKYMLDGNKFGVGIGIREKNK